MLCPVVLMLIVYLTSALLSKQIHVLFRVIPFAITSCSPGICTMLNTFTPLMPTLSTSVMWQGRVEAGLVDLFACLIFMLEFSSCILSCISL